MKNCQLKIGNLKLRTATDSLGRKGKHTTMEVVQWGDKVIESDENYCWTVAYWEKSDDSYSLKFVGNRPFDKKIIVKDFWRLIKIGQKLLDHYYNSGS